MKILMTSTLLALASIGAQAASFDCKKASTPVEKMICSSPRLNAFDEAMSTNYKYVHDFYVGKGQADLRKQQRAWISKRDSCTTERCVEEAYKTQMDDICQPLRDVKMYGCTSSYDVELELDAAAKKKK